VHCRAGIGRTGTVVGCWLVEQGLAGEDALDELNRLWQQCERSQVWISIPETEAQVEYVRRWAPRARPAQANIEEAPSASANATTSAITMGGESDPLLNPAALSAARGLRDRFLGALLGLAVGDAVAAATQYRRQGTFAPVGDMLGGGPFDLPRGAWSDDTAMALCLADSLLECNGFNARDQVDRYHRWQQQGYLSATGQCVGITASTARALAMAQWRRQMFSGSHDPNQLDPEPLSRVAPVVMYFFAAGDAAVEQSSEAARTTCQAPVVLDSCRVFARALHAALAGQSKEAILAQGPASAKTLPPGNDTAPDALAAAFAAFATTNSFRDAILRAANLGGSSDVVSAVCGQLAGAHYTASAIPGLWRNSLMEKALIERCADRLLAQAMLALAE
jgi:ADP-ribosyl-[dinitrogen reductase] hydrolase